MKLMIALLTWAAIGLLIWAAVRINTTFGILTGGIFLGCVAQAMTERK